jgi:hypothetical protein
MIVVGRPNIDSTCRNESSPMKAVVQFQLCRSSSFSSLSTSSNFGSSLFTHRSFIHSVKQKYEVVRKMKEKNIQQNKIRQRVNPM